VAQKEEEIVEPEVVKPKVAGAKPKRGNKKFAPVPVEAVEIPVEELSENQKKKIALA